MSEKLIPQYRNSPVLVSLVDRIAAAMSVGTDINTFYAKVADLDTATGYGLDVWGRRLGISRDFPLTIDDAAYFGFDALPGFDQAPFGE